jgi:hypothetical protein
MSPLVIGCSYGDGSPQWSEAALRPSAPHLKDIDEISVRRTENGTLEMYAGFTHGMPTSRADAINAERPAFF